MPDPDFWTQSAEAMEQTIEGHRLIATEIAGLVRQAWHTIALKFEALISGLDDRGHLPPI